MLSRKPFQTTHQCKLAIVQYTCALIAYLICAANPAIAQDAIANSSQWKRGYDGLHLLCLNAGLEPLGISKVRSVPENEIVLLILGDLRTVNTHFPRMIDKGAAALVAADCSKGRRIKFNQHFSFDSLDSHFYREKDRFLGHNDCPLITDIRSHAATDGVREIATNRPGKLLANTAVRIASLPIDRVRSRKYAFAAAIVDRSGNRMLGVADQSVFSNQMITYRDNAIFANQSIEWLKERDRRYFLMIVDGKQYSPTIPTNLPRDDSNLPAPTQAEVLDALQNLPPSALLEFANEVATVAEDDGLLNDFMHDNLAKVSDVKMNRFLLFLMFAMASVSFVVAFLWQKSLQNQTATQIAIKGDRKNSKKLKSQQARDRHWAARVLLNSLCVELADRRYNDWPEFPSGLEVGTNVESKAVFNSMTKVSNLFKTKPDSYWTRSRLRKLKRDVTQWRKFFIASKQSGSAQ